MKTLLLTTAAILAAVPAFGANVITFAQTANINEVTATTNLTNTATTLTVTDAPLSIGQFITGAPPAVAFFDFSATSIDPAATLGSAVIQHYSGSFCIATGAGCTGVDVLSGTFSDAAFGALTGPGLTINVNSPPDTLAFSSSLIPATELLSPNAFGLSFTNLTPALAIAGTTIADFTATLAGDASSTPVAEPSSLAILGLGLVGLGFISSRRKHLA